jgi:predicted RNase H-like HicB family nuclease
MNAKTLKYAVVFEKGEHGYSAYPPDLPGVGVAAETLKETERLIREAIQFHIEGLRLHGEPIPLPTSICEYIDVDAAEPAAR